MDGFRDAGLPTASSADWNQLTSGFDEESWKRLELLTRLFRETAHSAAARACLAPAPARAKPRSRRSACARRSSSRSSSCSKSPFRVEELARKWIAALGGSVAGETAEESASRMERLDFGGVLRNLRAADEDRAARMKKLQEIEARRLAEQQEAYAPGREGMRMAAPRGMG